jgi:hypothetical protein
VSIRALHDVYIIGVDISIAETTHRSDWELPISIGEYSINDELCCWGELIDEVVKFGDKLGVGGRVLTQLISQRIQHVRLSELDFDCLAFIDVKLLMEPDVVVVWRWGGDVAQMLMIFKCEVNEPEVAEVAIE